MTDLLRITGLSKAYGASLVLDDIDLSLPRGQRLAIVGGSGSGKTTLLRLIAGLDTPTAGEILIGGQCASRAGRLLVPPQRRGAAMVFQGLALFPHLRALDQIAFAARGRGGRDRAIDLLKRVGLEHSAAAPLDQLSGGERQRIALARALAQEPALLLMDEPFASLDDQRRSEMRGLLGALLSGTDTTLILVTHARDDALALADRVLVLDAGRPVAGGTLAQVLADPRHPAAVRCLGLGDVIDGHTQDGVVAQTPFGIVKLARPVPSGNVRILLRPAQPRLSSDGTEAKVVSIELRPPSAAGQIRRRAHVRAHEQMLRIEVDDDNLRPGEGVYVRIYGDALPLDGE